LGFSGTTVTTTVAANPGSYAYPIVASTMTLMDCANHAPCYRYDPSAAAGYAWKWRKRRNDQFYPRNPNDCTNFVSQVIHAGNEQFTHFGHHVNNAWWSERIVYQHGVHYDSTGSWQLTPNLYAYLVNLQLAKPFNQHDKHHWKKGDLIFWQWKHSDPGQISHVQVVYKTQYNAPHDYQEPYMLQHSPHYDEPKSLSEVKQRAQNEGIGVKSFVHLRPDRIHP
jgi:hypothetical protein